LEHTIGNGEHTIGNGMNGIAVSVDSCLGKFPV